MSTTWCEDIYGPGSRIESVHSDDNPTDIPVPGVDSDSDLDDPFWTKWLEEIKVDEYFRDDTFLAMMRREDSSLGDSRGASGTSATDSAAGDYFPYCWFQPFSSSANDLQLRDGDTFLILNNMMAMATFPS